MPKRRKKARKRPSKRRPLRTNKKRERPIKFPKEVRDWAGGFRMKLPKGTTIKQGLEKNASRVIRMLAAVEGPATIRAEVTMTFRRDVRWRDMRGSWRNHKGRFVKQPSAKRLNMIKQYRHRHRPKPIEKTHKYNLRMPVSNRTQLKSEMLAATELKGILKIVDSKRGRKSPWAPTVEIAFRAAPIG